MRGTQTNPSSSVLTFRREGSNQTFGSDPSAVEFLEYSLLQRDNICIGPENKILDWVDQWRCVQSIRSDLFSLIMLLL